MNFNKIKSIKQYDEYLNSIFRKARSIKDYEKKINNVNKNIGNEIQLIFESFPDQNKLDEFYKELIELDVDWGMVRGVFSKLIFIKRKVFLLSQEYKQKIRKGGERKQFLKEYYGRVSSLFKKNNKTFEFLEEVRKKLIKLPVLKKIESIGIIGYPNVGKSTLLKNLTKANPKISNYAFTTQKMNLGHLGKLQIMDLPGSLDKKFSEMNKIEKYSYIIFKHLCNKIIFVIDLTESSGDIIEQEKVLSRNLKEFKKKEFIIYFSKLGLVDRNLVNNYINKYSKFKTFSSYGKLKKFLLK